MLLKIKTMLAERAEFQFIWRVCKWIQGVTWKDICSVCKIMLIKMANPLSFDDKWYLTNAGRSVNWIHSLVTVTATQRRLRRGDTFFVQRIKSSIQQMHVGRSSVVEYSKCTWASRVSRAASLNIANSCGWASWAAGKIEEGKYKAWMFHA